MVVRGTARVTVEGDQTFGLKRREHLSCKAAGATALENPGKVVLEVIEVQLGEYLAEGDIVRLRG